MALCPPLPQGWPQTGSCLASPFGFSVVYLICPFLALLGSAGPGAGRRPASVQGGVAAGHVGWPGRWGGPREVRWGPHVSSQQALQLQEATHPNCRNHRLLWAGPTPGVCVSFETGAPFLRWTRGGYCSL